MEINDEEIAKEKKYFDSEIWPNIKNDLEEMTKQKACSFCFHAGSEAMRSSIEGEIKNAGEEVGKMSTEEVMTIAKEMSAEEIKKIVEEGRLKDG